MPELLLVRPGFSNPMDAHWSTEPPLGLAYLAASARMKGLGVAIIDGKLEKHRNTHLTAERILSFEPSFVGISAMTREYPDAIEIARELKSARPHLVTILGGVHANALPEESLRESNAFDFVMTGECEDSLVSLIKTLKNNESFVSIPGLFWRTNAGKIKRGPPPSFADLSTMPYPAWDLFPLRKTYVMLTERGCPYTCVFCSHNTGRIIRSRSLDSVKGEIEWLYKDFKPREIYIEDETFGINPLRTRELLSWLADFNKDKGIVFKAQTRIDKVSEGLMTMMKKAGFEYVELGVESGDDGVLKKSSKGITVAKIKEAVAIIKQAGLKTWLNFIIGLPGESESSIRNTMDLAARMNPDWLSVALIVPYPGCKIYEWARKSENGYDLISDNWSKFDKYLGKESVRIQGLSFSRMKQLQIKMYLNTFIKNLRLGKLAKLLWESRSLITS